MAPEHKALKDSPLHRKPGDADQHPKTLEEAVIALDKMLNEETRSFLNAVNQETAALELHHSLGRYLRNKWCLWQGSELSKNLREIHGIEHPDEMSHTIIMAYCKRHE
jgi:hypothetical protein